MIGRSLVEMEFLAKRDPKMQLSAENVKYIIDVCGAHWCHDGDMTLPHVEYTSGVCSNEYFNLSKLAAHVSIWDMLAWNMYRKVRANYNGLVDWVVASDHVAITLGYSVARNFGPYVLADSCEKGEHGKQIWRRHNIPADKTVLIVEDITTTHSTIHAVEEGVLRAHTHPIRFAPVTAVLVNNSGRDDVNGWPIVCLAKYQIKTWPRAECPLCAAGSEPIRPKDRKNWERLTGRAD